MRPSMGSVGDARDKAMAESVFPTPEAEGETAVNDTWTASPERPLKCGNPGPSTTAIADGRERAHAASAHPAPWAPNSGPIAMATRIRRRSV